MTTAPRAIAAAWASSAAAASSASSPSRSGAGGGAPATLAPGAGRMIAAAPPIPAAAGPAAAGWAAGGGRGRGGGCQKIVVDARSEAQERGEAGVAEQAVHDHVGRRHEAIGRDLPSQGGVEHHLGLGDHLVRRGGAVRHRRGEGHVEEVVGGTLLLEEVKIDLSQ